MQIKDSDSERIKSSAHSLVRRVIRVLMGCGISELDLREILAHEIRNTDVFPQSSLSTATTPLLIACSDVVLKWRRDSRFLTLAGVPAPLSLEHVSPSFHDLVLAVAPVNDPDELLQAMKELGVVRISGRDQVELISESVVACAGRDGTLNAAEFVLEHVCGFLGSVEYNLFDKASRTRGRFERACYASVPENLVPILENLVSSRGQEFVDAIDEWLARRAIVPTGAATVLVGAGAYVFVREKVK